LCDTRSVLVGPWNWQFLRRISAGDLLCDCPPCTHSELRAPQPRHIKEPNTQQQQHFGIAHNLASSASHKQSSRKKQQPALNHEDHQRPSSGAVPDGDLVGRSLCSVVDDEICCQFATKRNGSRRKRCHRSTATILPSTRKQSFAITHFSPNGS